MSRIYDTIIIGAGQSGMAMAFQLKEIGRDFLMIDGDNEVGGSWIRRWDSLKLFTPTEFNHLPGMPFPALKGHYPNKYEVADYLKDYAKKFDFKIELNQMVFAIEKQEDDLFAVECQSDQFYAKEVILATGPFHIPFTPSIAKNLDQSVVQLHAKDYLNPSLSSFTTLLFKSPSPLWSVAE